MVLFIYYVIKYYSTNTRIGVENKWGPGSQNKILGRSGEQTKRKAQSTLPGRNEMKREFLIFLKITKKK